MGYAWTSGIDAAYAVERYTEQARRCYEVMDWHLAITKWFGTEFSIADLALFPWTRTAKGQGIALDDYPDVLWSEWIACRPSAQVKPVEDAALGAPAGKPQMAAEGGGVLLRTAFGARAGEEAKP